MAQYSPGELDKFYYVPEVAYGTTPTDALTWGCDILRCKPKINPNKEFHRLSGSRGWGAVVKGGWDIGFDLEGLAHVASGAYDWTKLWATYGMGSTTGLTTHLGSFTGQVSKTVAAATTYDYFNGCKINKLTISSDGPGKLIKFKAEVMCRWVEEDTDKNLTGLQTVAVGANASDISTAVLTWAGVSQINIAAGGLANWYPRKWELVIDNHLERHPGNITGADSADYSLTYALSEGDRDIILTATLPYEGETYTAAKKASSTITALTLPIDNETMTLSTGEFMVEDEDWPEYSHALMDEQVRISFKSLTIA